jgi:3-hydroxyacyl-[acyl-carrier-protein] dehydratase
MPGVLMLEAMFQAAMWLVRRTDDFQSAVVLLKEARNVKYTDFVRPEHTLIISAEIMKHDTHTTTLKAEGQVDGSLAVSGRLVLERFNPSERGCGEAVTDVITRNSMRRNYGLLVAGIPG